MTWGTLQALSKNPRADIIYHKGDIGKEAMIITVFGKNLGEVAAKIKEILKNYWTLGCSGVTLSYSQSHSASDSE